MDALNVVFEEDGVKWYSLKAVRCFFLKRTELSRYKEANFDRNVLRNLDIRVRKVGVNRRDIVFEDLLKDLNALKPTNSKITDFIAEVSTFLQKHSGKGVQVEKAGNEVTRSSSSEGTNLPILQCQSAYYDEHFCSFNFVLVLIFLTISRHTLIIFLHVLESPLL